MLETKIKSPLSHTAETIVLMLAILPVGICQTTAADENEPASSETVEEITVYGKKSLTRLRYEVYAAEEDVFAVFNEVNSNDDFDVHCDYKVFLGNRRRHHLCIPRFAERAEAESILDASSSVADWWSESRMFLDRARVKRKNEQLWTEMATLLVENPELHEAISKLARSKLAYETERKRRRND